MIEVILDLLYDEFLLNAIHSLCKPYHDIGNFIQ